MRSLLIVGVLLVLAGSYILIRGFSVTTERQVLDAGPLEVTAKQQRAVPPWLGGVGVAAGLVLIIAGAGARTGTRSRP